jgi:hypothetical protein
MNYALATYVSVGAFYGCRLVRRYAQSPGDAAFIVLLSVAAWPFLWAVERGR